MSKNSLQQLTWKKQQESYVNFKTKYNLKVLQDIFNLICPLCDGSHGNNSLCQMDWGFQGEEL